MVAADEDALICDLAEVYHIADYRALPIQYVATLACGLSPDSRIKMAVSGARARTDTILLAALVDRMSTLVWMNSKDGQKGQNRPAMILSDLYGKHQQEITTFASGADFDAARAALVRRCKHDGD
ncbi:MAG: DUF5361 domain-containing protein [Oscillospiraceae bacterium]|nr:DUF5361 domain-containing protein [Oscillospiraceae bacterium]